MNRSMKALLICFVVLAVVAPILRDFAPSVVSIVAEAMWRGLVTGFIVGMIVTGIYRR